MTPERLNPQQFELFRAFIYRRSGIHIATGKVTMLSNRIRSRVNACGMNDFDAYYRFLTSPAGASELSGFLDAVTTNETFFFRTEKQFEWFKSRWIAEQSDLHRKGKRSKRLRILSAACSTGAEAYSLAICLAENSYRLHGWDLRVVGTDISEAALETARRATYKSKLLEKVSGWQRKKFFQRTDDPDAWQVRDPVRELVEFQNQNLMEPMSGETKFDCIFLRNVLIYFDRQSKLASIDHLRKALAPGGYIVTGPSEGVYGMMNGLERVEPLIYRKAINGSTSTEQRPKEVSDG